MFEVINGAYVVCLNSLLFEFTNLGFQLLSLSSKATALSLQLLFDKVTRWIHYLGHLLFEKTRHAVLFLLQLIHKSLVFCLIRAYAAFALAKHCHYLFVKLLHLILDHYKHFLVRFLVVWLQSLSHLLYNICVVVLRECIHQSLPNRERLRLNYSHAFHYFWQTQVKQVVFWQSN